MFFVVPIDLTTFVFHCIDFSQIMRSMDPHEHVFHQHIGKIQRRLATIFQKQKRVGSSLIISRFANIFRDFKNIMVFKQNYLNDETE